MWYPPDPFYQPALPAAVSWLIVAPAASLFPGSPAPRSCLPREVTSHPTLRATHSLWRTDSRDQQPGLLPQGTSCGTITCQSSPWDQADSGLSWRAHRSTLLPFSPCLLPSLPPRLPAEHLPSMSLQHKNPHLRFFLSITRTSQN